MFSKQFILYFGLLIILIGCQSQPASTAAIATPRQDVLSTPTPAATTITSAPTSIVSDYVTIQSYVHPSQRFSINYPDSWLPVDRPDGVLFLEPADDGGYSIFFDDVGQSYDLSQLQQYLALFITKNLIDDFKDISIIEETQQPDGSVMIRFSAVEPGLATTMNELRAFQVETILFITLISATEEQWPVSQTKLHELVNSFTPLDTSPAAQVTPTPTPPVWELVGPRSSEFGFLYPSDWEIISQEKNSVTVGLPDTAITFRASNYPWPGDASAAAENAAQDYLLEMANKYEDVEALPMTEFPLYNLTGATIDFVYTTEAGDIMAASVITAAQDGKIYRVVFQAPAEVYETSLNWFNPMYKSFKILSTEGLIILDEE